MAEDCNQRCGPTYHNDLYEESFSKCSCDPKTCECGGDCCDGCSCLCPPIQKDPGAVLRADLKDLDEPSKVSALQRIWRLLNGF